LIESDTLQIGSRIHGKGCRKKAGPTQS